MTDQLTDLREYKTVSAEEFESECYRVRQWFLTDKERLFLHKGYWEKRFFRENELIAVIRKPVKPVFDQIDVDLPESG